MDRHRIGYPILGDGSYGKIGFLDGLRLAYGLGGKIRTHGYAVCNGTPRVCDKKIIQRDYPALIAPGCHLYHREIDPVRLYPCPVDRTLAL